METVIKQAEENRSRSLNIASRIHEEYVPLKGEVDHMRREYLGLNPLPELHEEEGSVITAEYVQCFTHSIHIDSSICFFFHPTFSRFQSSFYHPAKGSSGGGVIGSHTVSSNNFARPTLNSHHPITPEATVTSLAPSAPASFLPPPPPVAKMRIQHPPSDIGGPNRMQQSPSIGMAHPTFRSEFNVHLRYFFIICFCFDFIFALFWPTYNLFHLALPRSFGSGSVNF